MLITKPDLEQYIAEIDDLYEEHLGEKISGVTHFAIIENDSLQAVASVKCYSGHWYLRGCVVKPEYRGKGLQRELIRERLEYLGDRTAVVRVSVYPKNTHSLQNIESEGFEFEKIKKLKNDDIVRVYIKSIN